MVAVIVSFILYAFILFSLLFLKTRVYGADIPFLEYIRHSSNLVPFKTITTYIKALTNGSMNRSIPIQNLVGNLLLFMPFGFYLPFFTQKLSKIPAYIGSVAAFIIILEAIQILTRTGSFDIDDFILNIAGALIAFLICQHTPIRALFRVRTKAT